MLLRKKLAVLLSALAILVVMSVPVQPPTFVDPSGGELVKLGNNGTKANDGPDKNKGGGQETPKKPKHRGGIV